MKNWRSLAACAIICIALVQYRWVYSDLKPGNPPLKVTVWDAFGYYAYLPSLFIYHDCTHLDWLHEVDKKYSVTGGNGWQAQKLESGKYVFKYLGGVAIMEAPFFVAGHFIAKHSHYPQDGFSPPYQYALGFGVIFYCILSLLLLRRILLIYFSDNTTFITLLMVCLATNFIQYAAIDNGQSHAYIFPLYVLVLFATIRWHQAPKVSWALLIGYIVGLASIGRPTEAIMLFIPVMWSTHNKESSRLKWQQVRQHKMHILIAAVGIAIGVLPQLIYWKAITGSFVYDVGSKWEFLNPHFRVLFGWEKGWFIYTPITIFFVAGLFFMKRFEFAKSALWFCLLNIYIIIAWHDWRYGGSYSTRALVQSYPVFALPFAAITERINGGKWRLLFYLLCAYLLIVNLFQIWQYNSTVLHYDDMNRRYYGRIYLNPHPSPIDMSLLDNNEILSNEHHYKSEQLIDIHTRREMHFTANNADTIASAMMNTTSRECWVKILCTMKAPGCLWLSYLNTSVSEENGSKHCRARLFNALIQDSASNHYICYLRIPPSMRHCRLCLYVTSPFDFNGILENVTVIQLNRLP